MASKKEKNSKGKTSFKTFGNFLSLHMMKKFTRRKKGKKYMASSDALEAGFAGEKRAENDCSESLNRKIDEVEEEEADSSIVHRNNSSRNGMSSSECGYSNGNGMYSGALKKYPTTPGICGLANHGTTCYMNAIIQCLSNTDVLAEYFVMGQYKIDLKNAKKERSKKFGTKGELAEQLALIIRNLWTGQYTNEMTKGLKDIMCKYAPQYKGNEQHDSQEFMLWLFDKVHEDLNIQPSKRKAISRRTSLRKSISRKHAHEKVNVNNDAPNGTPLDLAPTSFVQKVFQGHYRSSLTCPNCRKQSHTTDPFLCVSLPISQRMSRPLYINVFYLPHKRKSTSQKRYNHRVVRIGVEVPIDGKLLQLRHAVAAECGIHSRLLVFSELSHDGFGQSFGDDVLLSDIPSSTPSTSPLHAFEMPVPTEMTAGTLPRNFASRHKKRPALGNGKSKDALASPSAFTKVEENIAVIVMNKQGIGKQGKRFGKPLIFHVSRQVLASEMQSVILSQMTEYTKQGIREERMGALYRLQVVDGIPKKCYFPHHVQQPLLLPTVEKALENCPAGGPLHVKLIAEWDADTKSGIFDKIPEEQVEEKYSVRYQRVLHQQPVICTLEECFELHTKEEELGVEDAWNCPHCFKQRHGTVKQLSLYTLPEVLVIHLKRFRVVNDKRTKLNTRVEFPITGLDMSKHLCKSSQSNGTFQNGHGFIGMNGFRARHAMSNGSQEYLYDLYAVCNHFGNLNAGHYTACCSNSLDGHWYLFDDKRTELISEEKLSQHSVYILFYKRRSSNHALSHRGGSVSSLTSEHWAYHLPQYGKLKANSQSHLNHYATAVQPTTKNGNRKAENKNSNNNNLLKHDLQNTTTNGSRRYSGSFASHKSDKQQMISNKKIKKKEKVAAIKILKDDSDDGGFLDPDRSFIRGVQRQQSVPRSSGSSRRPVQADRRRMSERQSRSRPASEYNASPPAVDDTYRKMTYF